MTSILWATVRRSRLGVYGLKERGKSYFGSLEVVTFQCSSRDNWRSSGGWSFVVDMRRLAPLRRKCENLGLLNSSPRDHFVGALSVVFSVDI
jgi:hypothetical protein